MKTVLKVLLGLVVLLVLGAGVAVAGLSEPRPEGQSGPEADALAQEMLEAVNAEAWAALPAVRWTFAGRNEHLWDKQRQLARVRQGDTETLLSLGDVQGRAWRKGEELHGRRAEKAVQSAYAAWVNDSFWLNPVVKAFDEGTERLLVDADSVLVQYSSGGLTPGDAYLWHLGPDRLPSSWQLWVSVIPIGGASVTWEGWQALPGGAQVSTRHDFELLGMELLITELAAGPLPELEPGGDPFKALQPSETPY
ncbi:MAG: hypothetical protein H6741_29085 [Alphaproteobacteria bacterium]|nr:hypothetical protein [Alphaproteobacteria bacterium]MCB9796774.1 hypothetical protein [Alphaproteobacteria bacterium]